MRNRLLPLAVLAIALGLATAAYADISVITVIANPDGSWDVKAKLWGNGGIGTDAGSLGMYDFTLGVNGVAGGQITESYNLAPQIITGVVDKIAYGEGFFQPGTLEGVAAKNGRIIDGNVTGITSWQNGIYGTVNDPDLDGKVYANCGITIGGSAYGAWEADMKVASGRWNGTGSLQLAVAGRIAVSVLPNSGGFFVGPMTTIDSTTYVKAMVTQTISGVAGNNGGAAAYAAPTAMNVQAGELRLGSLAVQDGMAQFLSLSIDGSQGQVGQQEAAKVTLDFDQSIKNLSINIGAAFTNGLDLNGKMLSIYGNSTPTSEAMPQDLLDAELALRAAINSAGTRDGDGAYIIPLADGLYDSTIVGSLAKAIGTAVQDDGTGTWALQVRAAYMGDTDLNGNVSGGDLSTLYGNWRLTTDGPGNWWEGDFDRNGNVSGGDLSTLYGNWRLVADPLGGGSGLVPEPCTLAILSLGLVGLLRKNRKA